jgi:TolA-binding protein
VKAMSEKIKRLLKGKAILISVLALCAFGIIAATIAIAGSGSSPDVSIAQTQVLAQKQLVLDSIGKGDRKAADESFKKLTELDKNDALAEAIYSIGTVYQYKNWDASRANSAHKFIIENFPTNSVYVMLSGVELIRSQLRSGKNADEAVSQWMSLYKNRTEFASELPNSIYLIAQAYSNNKKDEKANPLFQYVASTYPKTLYGTLSQMRIDAINKDFNAADVVGDYLISRHRDNPEVEKAIRSLAEYYRTNKEYERSIHFYTSIIDNYESTDDPVKPYREAIYSYIDMNDVKNARDLIKEMQKSLAGNKELARANFDIANYFLKTGDSSNGLKLHKFNVENYTESVESLWSQAAIVWFHVRAGDEENANIEYAKMLSLYKDAGTIGKEVAQIGDIYVEIGNTIKARSLYQQVLDEWPQSEYVLNARAGFIKADIHDGNDTNVMTDINDLIKEYKNKTNLPPIVLDFGRQYWKQANETRAQARALSEKNTKEVLTEDIIQKYLKARKIWNELINELPDSRTTGEATFMVAETHNTLNETQQALPIYQNFLEKWPDFNFSWVAQDRIIKIYKRDGLNDSKSGYKSEDLIIAGYETLVEKFPDSPGAEDARKKLESYRKQKKYDNIDLKNMTNEQIYDLAKQIVEAGGSK